MRMRDFGAALRSRFARNLAAHGQASADVPSAAGHEPSRSLSESLDEWWQPAGDVEGATLQVDLAGPSELDTVVLQEAIEIGQRVESFSIELLDQQGWEVAYRGTVIGHKHIATFRRRGARSLRVRFDSARGSATLAFLGAYLGPTWKTRNDA
jgi:alpha-L-fucosidase